MPRRLMLLPVVLLFANACATTGATYRSGVGERMLSRAPWYAGANHTPVAAAGTRVGTLPVVFQLRQEPNGIFDPQADSGSALALLLDEMNGFLDSLTVANGSRPVHVIAAGGTARTPIPGVAPDVRFGCLTEGDLPGEDCIARGDSVLGRQDGLQQMKLSVGRPSPEWTAWAQAEMQNADVAHTLVITLEVGQYLVRQSGLRGSKSVDLGTNHTVSLPWLTSLELPVQTLQLTGALVDQNGLAVRIGAEGILAKRTGLLASSVGLQALISDKDAAEVRALRRTELPGTPLAWQEAMRQLVHGLTR